MEVKDIIYGLRVKKGLSQDALARKVMVTRQAVSRWENGETVPNTETLKLLSKEFDVSINTLLGTPRKLICQCCGMPLEDDEMIGRDKDGSINEDYCRWCYADGTYTYSDMEDLINVCVKNMVTDNFTEEQARSYMKELLPKLDYWKRYDELSDHGEFEKFKKKLLKEINALHVEGLPEITRLNALVGKYVNLEYTLPNGRNVKFLDDQTGILVFLQVWISSLFAHMKPIEPARSWFYTKNDKIRSFPTENLPDFFQVLSKKDSFLPFFRRQSLFDHKSEKSFQVIVVTVQVIEDTGGIKLF